VASTRVSRQGRVRLVVLLSSVAVAAAVIPAAVGSAAPASTLTLHQAKVRVAALNEQAEKITQSYDAAQDSLTTLRKQEAASALALAHDQKILAAMRQKVSAAAAAAYRSGGLSATTSLVSTGSAETFLEQTASLNEVAQYQANEVTAAAAAQRQVAAAEALHNAQITRQRAIVASISSDKQHVDSLLGQAKAVLARLTAAQQRKLAEQQQAAHARAVSQRSSYHPPARTPTYSGPASGQASKAVQFAYAQLGKPYQWGAAGPGSYDCSGLAMMAWRAAGVSLPHNAAMQQASIPSVSLSSLQPGDLVFLGDPAYHVMIYIGGGRVIQAPYTGADVEISSLSGMSPSGAGRP
jgi:cell wall-associated NlpC family hydrolase